MLTLDQAQCIYDGECIDYDSSECSRCEEEFSLDVLDNAGYCEYCQDIVYKVYNRFISQETY